MQSRHEVSNAIKEPKWIEGWDGYKGWMNWGIILQGALLPSAWKLPKTTSMLRQVPGITFAGLLIMKPGTIFKKHSHPENAGLMTYHLGLDVPEDCYLKSDDQFISEKNGYGFIFDGTRQHYAFNASEKNRLILHCEYLSGTRQ